MSDLSIIDGDMTAKRIFDNQGVLKSLGLKQKRIKFTNVDNATYNIAMKRFSKSGKLRGPREKKWFAVLETEKGKCIVNRASLVKRFGLEGDDIFNEKGEVSRDAMKKIRATLENEDKDAVADLKKRMDESHDTLDSVLNDVPMASTKKAKKDNPEGHKSLTGSFPKLVALKFPSIVQDMEIKYLEAKGEGKTPSFVKTWVELQAIKDFAGQKTQETPGGQWELLYKGATEMLDKLRPYCFGEAA